MKIVQITGSSHGHGSTVYALTNTGRVFLFDASYKEEWQELPKLPDTESRPEPTKIPGEGSDLDPRKPWESEARG